MITMGMLAEELGKITRIGERRICVFNVGGLLRRCLLGLDSDGYYVREL